MSKIEWEKAVVSAALFTTVSYLIHNFILTRWFPVPEKPEAPGDKGNMSGMPGCDCASRHWRGY